MLAFLKRFFVVLVGLLLSAVFIWYAGPYFEFAEYRPLATERARLIAIAVVVGCWLAVRLVKRLRSFRASDRLLAAVVAQPQSAEARPPAEVLKLRERFEEAVSALRQQRRSGYSLYDLPWYVIIGAPGSGKTTALRNSGLKFPLEQRMGKGELRGVGGTRNCDWWFADEAVFLDTAGRYTTQDSDAASDSAGWSEFLALLRKYRARRPVNGVIVTVSAHDLLVLDPAGREAHVDAARSRLDELNRELRIQLPVYLMVTKCDLVDGFAEYFEDLTAEGRAQVWGVTFPYEQTLANEGPQVFPAEFDALVTRLNERVFGRVEEERNARRRTKVFAFPQQMVTLRDALTRWVSDVFSFRDFGGRVLLRGVYFTSGTQEGTPIDRLLGSIGRTFGAADALMRPAGPGKAYFVQNLLKEVMIGESGLAGVNRRLELRNASVQLGAYVAAGLIAAAGVAALSVSYHRNRLYLDSAAADIDALAQTAAVTPASPLDQVIARLDAIRAVVDSSAEYHGKTPWTMRWGLYQGGSIGKSASDAYRLELRHILVPQFAAQIEDRLRQHATDPETLYEYLKGYLMLAQPKPQDPEHLKMIAEIEWGDAGAGASRVAPTLLPHFIWLLENGGSLQLPDGIDGTLVAQARSSLDQASWTGILYEGLKRDYLADTSRDLRVDQLAGLGVERVFRRRSGIPLSTPMPGLYTRDVFNEIKTQGLEKIRDQLTRDAWVWGAAPTAALPSPETLLSGVTNKYESDYIRTWDTLLGDLQLVPCRTIQQTIEALRILTAETSPLRSLLRVVADNTTLVDPKSAPKGVVAETKKKVTDSVTSILKPLQKAADTSQAMTGREVTNHFQWVRQLTAVEPGGKTQLDAIIQAMAEIHQQLDGLGRDVAGRSPVQVLSDPSFRGLMQTFQQRAAELPRGLRTLVSEIAEAPGDVIVTEATQEIEQLYSQQIVQKCSQLIAGKYPFAPSQTDVQLADFGDVFGYGGLFDKFFTDHLEKQVDTSGRRWTWRPGSVNLSNELLARFQDARGVRDMFFAPGSKAPEVKFFVTFSDLDRSATRFVLEIDGQILDDQHLKQTVKWPGDAPGAVTATFEGTVFDFQPTAYSGPWAWFRMIDAKREGAPDAQQRLRLKIQNGNRVVRVTVEPSRASDNPFATKTWRQFSCGS